jgi:hypothetical protein
MKKLFPIVMGLVCAAAITATASAQDKKRPELTEEQKKIQKEMLDKYDTNKDGKLDKEERAKMSQEDKDKSRAIFGGGKKKEEKK